MTTPPTPAGWYPDPDGSGGQRFWDGSGWTEHRAPAAPPPPPPAAPPPPVAPPPVEPPAPAEFGSEPTVSVPQFGSEPTVSVPLGGEEQTAIVPLPPVPTDDQVGAHRKPEPEPFTQTTEPVSYTPDAPIPPPPPGPPPSGLTPAASSSNRGVIIGYLAACALLLAALVVAIVYGFFIKDSSDVEISAGGTTTSEATDAPTTTGDSGWGETSETETATDSPTTVAETGDATDGQLSFTVHGVEVGTTVVSSDAPIEKTAVGEYIVVHMTVTNVSPDPATFLGTFQKLLAGGTTYNIDDEATFYVGGGLAELPPGASADVSVAFDVPPGTEAEAIELHADPISPGVEVSLS